MAKKDYDRYVVKKDYDLLDLEKLFKPCVILF